MHEPAGGNIHSRKQERLNMSCRVSRVRTITNPATGHTMTVQIVHLLIGFGPTLLAPCALYVDLPLTQHVGCSTDSQVTFMTEWNKPP